MEDPDFNEFNFLSGDLENDVNIVFERLSNIYPTGEIYGRDINEGSFFP